MLLLKTKYSKLLIIQNRIIDQRGQFEMAAEETEKKTVYASKDREAAREALQRLEDSFENSLKLSSPSVAEEIRARVGQRIRDLNNAYTALEELAHEE